MWNGRTYHPNIGRVKSLHAAWKYVNKRVDKADIVFTDSDRHCHFDDPSHKDKQHGTKHGMWHTIIEQNNEKDFRAAMRKLNPERYITAHSSVTSYIAEQYKKVPKVKFTLPSGTVKLRSRRFA